mgnify:CR=1 FL=1
MQALVKYASGYGNVGIREVPVREPGDDDILIKVKYCGICGTDLHIYADEYPIMPPVTMGHEFAGTVVRAGRAAQALWQPGDRVVGELHTGACGVCELCLAGKPHICDSKLALGSKFDGAFAEYLTLPAWLAHPLPEGIPWEVAGVTEPFAISAHCLIERGRLSGTRSLLISGAATMGLMATIWASRLGVSQIIVSGTQLDADTRFPLALELGATRVVNIEREDLADIVRVATDGRGVDAWVECSGSGGAIRANLPLVKKTGKIVLIGLVGPETIAVPWNTLLYHELDVVGCFSSPPSSWHKALAAESDEAGKLRKLVTAILPLTRWEEGFEMVRRGEAIKVLIDLEA